LNRPEKKLGECAGPLVMGVVEVDRPDKQKWFRKIIGEGDKERRKEIKESHDQ